MTEPWHDLLTALNALLPLLTTSSGEAMAGQFSLIQGLQRALPQGQWTISHTCNGTQWQGRITIVEKPEVPHTGDSGLTLRELGKELGL